MEDLNLGNWDANFVRCYLAVINLLAHCFFCFREYCSGMMFNSRPKTHPYFTFDVIEEPLEKEPNIVKYLITEEIFLEAVRDVIDNSAYDQVLYLDHIF